MSAEAAKSKGKAPAKTQSRQSTAIIDSDDDMPMPKVKNQTQPDAPVVALKTTRRTNAKSKAPSKTQPLFIESDEEDELASEGKAVSAGESDDAFDDKMMADSGEDEESATLPSTGRTTQRTQNSRATQGKGRKRTAIVLDDDSDDGFTGFSKKRARR